MLGFLLTWIAATGNLVFGSAALFVYAPSLIDLSPGKDTEQEQALLAGYGKCGLPFVVLHDRTGRVASRITSYVDAERFLAIMRDVR